MHPLFKTRFLSLWQRSPWWVRIPLIYGVVRRLIIYPLMLLAGTTSAFWMHKLGEWGDEWMLAIGEGLRNYGQWMPFF